MVDVFLFASQFGLVFNAQDAEILRRDHRIVGTLVGCLPQAPRQAQNAGLPLCLLREEVELLRKQKVINLLEMPDLKEEESSQEVEEAHKKYLEESYQGQIEAFKESRKQEIISMLDQIVAGKRKKQAKGKGKGKGKNKRQKVEDEREDKNSDNEEPVIDKETVLTEELAKITTLPRHQVLVQGFLENPFLTPAQRSRLRAPAEFPGPLPPPLSAKHRCRAAAFSDLWHKQFYLTDGEKFGADFLAYPGDPLLYHARYVVICLASWHEMSSSGGELSEAELVAKCRLGTAVNKTVLFAYMKRQGEEETVCYKSIKWTGKV